MTNSELEGKRGSHGIRVTISVLECKDRKKRRNVSARETGTRSDIRTRDLRHGKEVYYPPTETLCLDRYSYSCHAVVNK